jgi:protein involved in polysaccharide export with SLBB domain
MPGDALRLSFSGEPNLNGEYAIDETGVAALPLLGGQVVTGRPAAEVKDSLIRRYAQRTRNNDVQVLYLRRVRVLGEVRQPGLYRVDPTMTFGDALALAGGASNDGNIRDVSLVRDDEVIARGIDMRGAVATTLHSGDQIYVPKTSWLSRYGAVALGATISAIGAIVAWRVH